METYYYTKWVKPHETVPFEEVLQLGVDLEIWGKIGVFIRPYYQSSEVTADNIEIQASEILLASELDQIASAINSFDENHELVVRNNVRIDTVDPNLSWARNMIATFGANNIVKGKSLTSLTTLISNFQGIIDKCQIGAVEMAYMELLLMSVDSTFTQGEKDEFIKRFEIHIGKGISDAIKSGMGL